MPRALLAEASLPLWVRFQMLWRLKLTLTVVVMALFWGVYLTLSRHAIMPVHELPLTWLDRWAGFRPEPWAWIYETVFVLIAAVPWLSTAREQLHRYVLGFALLSSISFLVFIAFPVASPRPLQVREHAFLWFLTQVDGPLNAFPSLHAGTLVYTLSVARRMFERQCPPLVWLLLGVWSLLILFATLATKQHYAVDLAAGAVLGLLADQVAWRWKQAPPPQLHRV